MVQVVSEYQHQVGGRSKLKRVYGDHLLKPTSEYEVESYLKMSSSIAKVAPECCAIIKNGQLRTLRPCGFCSEPNNAYLRRQILHCVDSGNYLIMKDVAHGFKNPRIMDLKLGTRTHSDYISDEKKKSRVLKCLQTTTSTIGLRLSGASFGDLRITKPTGLRMDTQDFVNTMSSFFDVPMEQKRLVVEQLSQIRKSLEECDSQRFFGSSLLIIIDDEHHKTVEKTVKVKLIDFSSMARSEEGMTQYDGVDQGAIFGVTNLLTLLE